MHDNGLSCFASHSFLFLSIRSFPISSYRKKQRKRIKFLTSAFFVPFCLQSSRDGVFLFANLVRGDDDGDEEEVPKKWRIWLS